MVLKTVLNQTINDEEVVETTNLFAVDYLKIRWCFKKYADIK